MKNLPHLTADDMIGMAEFSRSLHQWKQHWTKEDCIRIALTMLRLKAAGVPPEQAVLFLVDVVEAVTDAEKKTHNDTTHTHEHAFTGDDPNETCLTQTDCTLTWADYTKGQR